MKNNTKKSINIGKINIPLNYWTGLAVYAVKNMRIHSRTR